MRTILTALLIAIAFQASDCATAGSIQDSSVTKAKRKVDAEDMAKTTPAVTTNESAQEPAHREPSPVDLDHELQLNAKTNKTYRPTGQ